MAFSRHLAATAGAVFALLACAASSAQAQTQAPAPAPAPEAPRRPQALREGVAAVVNAEGIPTHDLRQRVLLLIVTSGVQVNEQNLPQIEAESLRGLID